MTYALYDMFLHKELPFGGRDVCTCVKSFSGIFVIAVNYDRPME